MSTRILIGDVREKLKELPDSSVQMCCTSPPYYGLRKYLPSGHEDERYEIGSEPTLAEYIATMVDVFRDVRRVLRDDGTLWLNIGTSFASHKMTMPDGEVIYPKDDLCVPERLKLALMRDGWRRGVTIIWHKKAPMPESCTDRPTSAHEHIFLLTKKPKYFYDADAVREGQEPGTIARFGNGNAPRKTTGPKRNLVTDSLVNVADVTGSQGILENGRNLRNVWTLGPEPYPDAHFATFPTEIPRRCIKAGTSERGCCSACGAPWVRVVEVGQSSWEDRKEAGHPSRYGDTNGKQAYKLGLNDFDNRAGGFGTPASKMTTGWSPSCSCDAAIVPCMVLDPFAGSGTTGLVADQLVRDSIMIELNPDYAAMAKARIYNDAPLFADIA